MANKDEFDFDNLDIDEFDDLDLGDEIDLDDGGDRTPTPKGLGGRALHMTSAAVNTENVKEAVKGAIPDKYAAPLEAVDTVRDTYTETMDSLKKDAEPAGRALAKAVELALPKYKNANKRIAGKVRSLFGVETDPYAGGGSGESKEARDNAEITDNLEAIFAKRAEQEDANRQVDKVEDRLKTVNEIATFNKIEKGISTLANYNNTILIGYQRKSLELKYRSYHALRDLLETTLKYHKLAAENQSAIIKNTGLPEYVKLRNKEAFGEALRTTTVNNLQDKLLQSDGVKFLKNFGGNLAKKAQAKGKAILGGIGGFAEGVSDNAELLQQMQADGLMTQEDMDAELASQIAGSGMSWGAKKIVSKLGPDHPLIKAMQRATDATDNAQFHIEDAEEWLRNTAENKRGEMGDPTIASRSLEGLADIIKAGLTSTSRTLQTETDIDQMSGFDKKEKQSLNVIIPGYLSKILQSVLTIQTGKPQDEVVFSRGKNSFSTRSTAQRNIVNEMRDIADPEQHSKKLEDVMSVAIAANGGKELSPEAAAHLNKLMTETGFSLADTNARSTAFGKHLTKEGHYKDTTSKVQEELSGIGKAIQEDKDLNDKFNRAALNVVKGTKGLGALVDKYINSGDLQPLVDSGIVKLENGQYTFNSEVNRELLLDKKHEYRGNYKQNSAGSVLGGGDSVNNITIPMPEPTGKTESINFLEEMVFGIYEHTEDINTLLQEKLNVEEEVDDKIDEQVDRPQESTPTTVTATVDKGITDILTTHTGKFDRIIELLRDANILAGSRNGRGFREDGKFSIKDTIYNARDTSLLVMNNLISGIGNTANKAIDLLLGKKPDKDDENGSESLKGKAGNLFSKLITGSRDLVTSAVTKTVDVSKDILLNKLPAGWSSVWLAGRAFGKKTKETALNLMTRARDVYVKGMDEPVLTKAGIQAGIYIDKATGKTIRSMRDIKGPVMDLEGNIVLTTEMLKGGIFDVHGKPIAHNAMQWLANRFSKGKDAVKAVWGKVKGIAKKGYDTAVNLKDRALGKLNIDPVKQAMDEKTNKKLDTIIEHLAKIRKVVEDGLPAKKKIFGDIDGDGDRDNSVKDILQRRREAAKAKKAKRDAANAKKGDGKTKEKKSSWFKGLLGGVFETIFNAGTIGILVAAGWKLLKKFTVKAAKGLWKGLKKTLAKPFKWVAGKVGGMFTAVKDTVVGTFKGIASKVGSVLGGITSKIGGLVSGITSKIGGVIGSVKDGVKKLITNPAGALKSAGGWLKDKAMGMWDKAKGAIKGAGKWIGKHKGAILKVGKKFAKKALAVGAVAVAGAATVLTGGAAAPLLVGAVSLAVTAWTIYDTISDVYAAYKWLTEDKYTLLKLRVYQYGIDPSDEDSVKKVLSTEKLITENKGMLVSGNVYELDPKHVNVDDILELWGITEDDQAKWEAFVKWFNGRFKPVFFNYQRGLKNMKLGTDMAAIDDLEGRKTYQLLNYVAWEKGPYDVLPEHIEDAEEVERTVILEFIDGMRKELSKFKNSNLEEQTSEAENALKNKLNKANLDKQKKKDKSFSTVPAELEDDKQESKAADQLSGETEIDPDVQTIGGVAGSWGGGAAPVPESMGGPGNTTGATSTTGGNTVNIPTASNKPVTVGKDGHINIPKVQKRLDTPIGGKKIVHASSKLTIPQFKARGGYLPQDIPKTSSKGIVPSWLKYKLGGVRNQPLSMDFLNAMSFLEGSDIIMEAYSAGQPARGSHRKGSHRHDYGHAADAHFYRKGDMKRRLNFKKDTPIFMEIVRRAKMNGIEGFGAGKNGSDYMGQESLHLGFGPPALWGKGGIRGPNGSHVPEWLKKAATPGAGPFADLGYSKNTKKDPLDKIQTEEEDGLEAPEDSSLYPPSTMGGSSMGVDITPVGPRMSKQDIDIASAGASIVGSAGYTTTGLGGSGDTPMGIKSPLEMHGNDAIMNIGPRSTPRPASRPIMGGNTPPENNYSGDKYKTSRPINGIVVHCSATPNNRDIGVKEITVMHKKRDFVTIGYHYVIRRDGTLEIGRDINKIGAHVKHHNTGTIGICLVGGINNAREKKPEPLYSAAQLKTLRTLINKLKGLYPGASILGHRDYPHVAKACPCFDVATWVKTGKITVNGKPYPGAADEHQAKGGDDSQMEAGGIGGDAGLNDGKEINTEGKDVAGEQSTKAGIDSSMSAVGGSVPGLMNVNSTTGPSSVFSADKPGGTPTLMPSGIDTSTGMSNTTPGMMTSTSTVNATLSGSGGKDLNQLFNTGGVTGNIGGSTPSGGGNTSFGSSPFTGGGTPVGRSANAKQLEGMLYNHLKKKGLSNTAIALVMGQMSHETAGFTKMYEQGTRSYFNKYERPGNKLGNNRPGDGYKYRGRGFTHLTGRWNYTHIGKRIGVPLAEQPDLAAQPDTALKIIDNYMATHGSGNGYKIAESGNIDAMTYFINGGYTGKNDRRKRTKQYLAKLGAGAGDTMGQAGSSMIAGTSGAPGLGGSGEIPSSSGMGNTGGMSDSSMGSGDVASTGMSNEGGEAYNHKARGTPITFDESSISSFGNSLGVDSGASLASGLTPDMSNGGDPSVASNMPLKLDTGELASHGQNTVAKLEELIQVFKQGNASQTDTLKGVADLISEGNRGLEGLKEVGSTQVDMLANTASAIGNQAQAIAKSSPAKGLKQAVQGVFPGTV